MHHKKSCKVTNYWTDFLRLLTIAAKNNHAWIIYVDIPSLKKTAYLELIMLVDDIRNPDETVLEEDLSEGGICYSLNCAFEVAKLLIEKEEKSDDKRIIKYVKISFEEKEYYFPNTQSFISFIDTFLEQHPEWAI